MGIVASKIEVYVAVIATVGVIIGAVAAGFGYAGWKAQRRRPDLLLIVRDTVRSYENQNAPVRDVHFEFNLTNEGDGPAKAWKLQFEPPSGEDAYIGGMDRRGYEERDWYAQDVRHRLLEWFPPGDADAIAPHGRYPIPCRAQLPESKTMTCSYSLTADRMKSKTGTIVIRHSKGEPVVEVRA